jgi:CheY-like chemotaxis protein
LTGSGRSFSRYARPVRGENGGLIGRLFGIRETTAEKEADRMKEELVATVSHELRTPLTSILGFTELLQTRDLSEEKRNRYLAMIHRETRRLTALVNDFLDLQRIEAGGFTLALEEVDLAALLREEVVLYDRPGAEHRVELRVPGEPLTVSGEPDRLRQVIGNLLSNAIKYSPGGGGVEVTAEARDGFVYCTVSDQGLGIPETAQRRIFQKFFRADSSDTRKIGGTGLGLALSRDLVEAHGGRMGFESVEGEGSTFWFELPGTRVAARDGVARVLVVEDRTELRTLIADLLGEAGYAVETVASGEAALASVATDVPSAIVLNIHLAGDLDGWQVLMELKSSPPTANVPVIVATGLGDRRQAGVLGASDYLAKPFTAGELLGAIARVLDGRAGDVLVVDDEESVRRLIVETLSSEGYSLREAADGHAALAAIRAQPPDAVLLDLLMPGLDGFGVLEQLRQDPELLDLPVVVLTGKRLSGSERDLLIRRADSLLEKNAFSGPELRRLIEEVVSRRRHQEQEQVGP